MGQSHYVSLQVIYLFVALPDFRSAAFVSRLGHEKKLIIEDKVPQKSSQFLGFAFSGVKFQGGTYSRKGA